MEVKAQSAEDARYYLDCPQRKGGGRIAVTVCLKKCVFARHDIPFDPSDPMRICDWDKFHKGKK